MSLEKLDKGWFWYSVEYRQDDGKQWEIYIAAQSFDDAETRVRCLRETATLTGQVIAEYPADDGDIEYGRTQQS